MDDEIHKKIETIHSADRQEQGAAYLDLMEAAEKRVDWAYDVWDGLVTELRSPDNRLRAIAGQLLCSLAWKSDPEKRILRDFTNLMALTRDPRFVTARHTLQAIWKVGAAGEEQKQLLLRALSERFAACIGEKNYMLVRYDIIVALKKLYDEIKDEKIRFLALKLINMEENPRNHRKDLSVWKKQNRAG